VLASTDKPQIMDAHHPCFLRYHIGYFEKLPATSLPVVKKTTEACCIYLKKRKNNRGGVPPPLAGGGKGVGVLASTDKPQIMDAHHQCFLRYHIGYFEKLPATSLPVVKNNRSVLHLLEKT
jgi:hypothetical protein